MFKIIGADGQQYGPVTAEQLRQWITEGRVNAQTLGQAEGSTDWKPLSTFPELIPDTMPPAVLPSMPPGSAPSVSQNIPKTSGLAVAGLVMGILSLIQCCSFVFGILGVIFSSVAISQINKRSSELTGKRMAVAGLVTSIVGLAINIVLIVIYWAVIMAEIANRR